MPFILGTNSIKDTGYDVANSLRFNDGSSDYLSLSSLGTATNNKKQTLSFWCKRSTIGSVQRLFVTNGLVDPYFQFFFQSNDKLRWQTYEGSVGSVSNFITTRVFRDTSAWYHFHLVYDTTQSTSTDRTALYVNGVKETAYDTEVYPSLNSTTEFDNPTLYIGQSASSDGYFDGYLAEFVVLDGQSITPDGNTGEFDSDSPTIWKPKDVSGLTFGNNGFYLDFEDSSALGNDAAGSNNFTVNNLTAIDQTTDTCTNNFCTVNSLDNYHQQATFSEGNTKITFKGATSVYAWSTGTFGLSSGKWYWETKATSAGNHDVYGISGRYAVAYNQSLGKYADTWGYYNNTGKYVNNNSYSHNFPDGNVTWTTNDIIGIALDLDSGTNTVKFYKNNSIVGTLNIGSPSSGFWYPAWNQFDNQAEVAQPNFGNPSYSLSSAQSDANGYGSFEFAPPSGYYALCSKNLAEYG
jgi:hypothetical protein